MLKSLRCPSWSISAIADHGAGEAEVSHCASMAANFMGWSRTATCAAECPLNAENIDPTAANTSAIRSERENTSTSWRRSRW
jgi:hypothetical protein